MYTKMLRKIPNDSKIVLSVVLGSLIGGVGLGTKKLMYDSDIIIKKNKNYYGRSLTNLDTVIFSSE